MATYIQRMLGEHEQVVFTTHQHWMVLASSFLVNFVLALVIVLASVGIALFVNMIGYFGLILLIVPVVRFIYHLVLWQNKEYLITNRRVIQIDGIFNKNVLDSSLEKVNDVMMKQSVLGRILDYGDVEILTAAQLGVNLFKRIAHPVKFKTSMLNQKESMGMGDVPGGMAPRTEDVPTMIESLSQLRQRGVISEEEFQKKKQDLLARM